MRLGVRLCHILLVAVLMSGCGPLELTRFVGHGFLTFHAAMRSSDRLDRSQGPTFTTRRHATPYRKLSDDEAFLETEGEAWFGWVDHR